MQAHPNTCVFLMSKFNQICQETLKFFKGQIKHRVITKHINMKTTKMLIPVHLIGAIGLLFWGCTKNDPPPPPIAITVSAGADIQLSLPVDSCNLTGSVTAGSEIKSYRWEKISGPAAYTIDQPDSLSTRVRGLQEGTYVFQFIATDIKGSQGNDAVVVNVSPASTNMPPIANAGADQTIMSPQSDATLDGKLSNDPDGTIVSYEWTKISGSWVDFAYTQNSDYAFIKHLGTGEYHFQLQVTDNNGATAKDTVIITVIPDSLTIDSTKFKSFEDLVWDNTCTIRLANISSTVPAGSVMRVYIRSRIIQIADGILLTAWENVVTTKNARYWYEVINDVLIIHAQADTTCVSDDLLSFDVLVKWN